MKLTEKENCFLIEDFFGPSVIAGYTKPQLKGNLPQDLDKALSFLDHELSLSYMKQMHSARVAKSERPGVYEADAVFTAKRNNFLAIKTADCLPLLFFSSELRTVGGVHMGWRSAYGGILENIPYDLSTFKVMAGVGMRACCYEVGSEFKDLAPFCGHLNQVDEKLFFNPVSFARDTLKSRGMLESNFFDLAACTVCQGRGFFSFRKTATKERTLSFIGLRR